MPTVRTEPLPARAGRTWDFEEDQRLLQSFDRGWSISGLAQRHQRTVTGIRARLIRHGRIEPNEEDRSWARARPSAAAGASPAATSAAAPAATRTVTIHFLPEDCAHLLRALTHEKARLDDVLRVADENFGAMEAIPLQKVRAARSEVEVLWTRIQQLTPQG